MPVVTRNGVGIHYELDGDGAPVVLHTGGGGDLEMWRLAGYVAGLRGDHRLILIDHRGHGKSAKPPALAAHRVEEYREDVRAVLDAVGASRAAFLGYSYGARIGYALADKYPDRISALIDLDGIELDRCEPGARAATLRLVADVRRNGFGKILRQMARLEDVPLEHPVLRDLAATDSEMFALALEAETAWKGPLTILARVKVPLLILLNGQRSFEDSTERILEVAGGRARTLPGLGHLRTFIESDRTLPLIRRFLAAHRG